MPHISLVLGMFTPTSAERVSLSVISLAAVLILVAAPLVGFPRVVRLPAVLVPAIVLAGLVLRPWRWREAGRRAQEWQPSVRFVWSGSVIIGLALCWYVLTRFQSAQINAVDFTVYFDRPCFQTVHGRPLFVENSDTPGYSNRSELADHAYWAMLPVCSLYSIAPTPLWLHGISALAVAAGAFFVLRIMLRMGSGGLLACGTALAFVLNDNTARALNYGFHPEILYAWFVPWMIDAGLRGSRKSFLVATLACVLVKEDACLPIFAVTLALGLHRFMAMTWSDRRLFLLWPNAAALLNLAVYYSYVVPWLTGSNSPSYSNFWANYGATPFMALIGMALHPWRVLEGAMTSGVWGTLRPHLFLPLIGWRWTLGVVPIILIYGASANDQVRAFGIYYAIVLVPFLVIGASLGALMIARRLTSSEGRAQIVSASVVLIGALLVGSGHRGYSLRAWRTEVSAVPQALASVSKEPVVLVQSGLFPHAGYEQHVKLLTPEALDDPRNEGAVMILAPRIGAYPFTKEELARLMSLSPVGSMPPGIVAVRLSKAKVQ